MSCVQQKVAGIGKLKHEGMEAATNGRFRKTDYHLFTTHDPSGSGKTWGIVSGDLKIVVLCALI